MKRARVTSCLVVLGSLFLAFSAQAGCPEPSAEGGATPLQVSRPSLGEVRLDWETGAGDEHRVNVGSLDALRSGYDHLVVAQLDPADGTTTLSLTSSSQYFLVGAACGVTPSSLGRDSSGMERPVAGQGEFTIHADGMGDIDGQQLELSFPTSVVVTADGVSFEGGLFEGDLCAVNDTQAGSLRVACAQFTLEPLPADTERILFGYYGPAPMASDFSFVECLHTGASGDPVTSTCEIRNFTISF
ncbi:MAG: hypothetical protein AAF533_01695 [Acidobacteriota bacterium]